MIDEKKIQEAANEYIGHEPELDEGIYVAMRRDAFKDGANWMHDELIKHLWHDASEKPKMGEHSMIIVEFKGIHSLWRSTTVYETLCNNKDYIRRWLYLDDLLKGGDND